MTKISTINLFIYLVTMATIICANLEIVSRSVWKARPEGGGTDLVRPVPYVVIHHSYIPPACNTSDQCMEAMRWMQDFHQINRSWWDIGYNFAVGGDGRVYQGRGWRRVGAHAPRYNNLSIGICLIGDWSDHLPPQQQLAAAQKLIEAGVKEGHIAEDYDLVGHKQVRQGTACPGDRLFAEIKKWPHYDSSPDEDKLRGKVERRTTTTTLATPPHEDNKLQKRTA